MPYRIAVKGGDRPYRIINKDTGKQVGSAKTLAKAKASVRAEVRQHQGEVRR